MNRVLDVLAEIICTLFRFAPFRTRRRLMRIGNPDENSPVLVTGNYLLTVRRLLRALKGQDCYVLIANSRGINVWCAATGGLFTNHDVISALKTSGIEEQVQHRQIILPQLAATGIERKVIQKKTGWKILWGPVYARDIPQFLNRNFEKTPEMKQVEFPLIARLEMAIAWAFPMNAVLFLINIFIPIPHFVFFSALIWGLSLLLFITFPLFARWLRESSTLKGFHFERGGIQIMFLVITLIILKGISVLNPVLIPSSWQFWLLYPALTLLILMFDFSGNTPVYKSSYHKDRFFNIYLDVDKCRGAAFCEQVCPRNCYEVDHELRKASIPRADLCVKCGACVVQCPFDAIYFKTPQGEIVPPEVTREFKLNLMGKRAVKV